jgi:hypothetical protein
MTIGQKVNLFPDEVSDAITELVKNGQARIKQRDNGTRDMFLLQPGDIETPDLAVRAGSEFYKTGRYRQFIVDRAKFLDRIFADERLTATDKIIAFAALRLMSAEYLLTSSSYRTIGKTVGRSRETAKLSIRRLLDVGYFDRQIVDGRLALFPNDLREGPGNTPGKAPGKTQGNASPRSPHLTELSSPNSAASDATGSHSVL